MLPKLQLGADSVFFDLGCGDGRWLVPAAQRYGCRCVGLEVQHDAAEDARAAATAGGVQHLVSVREEDFFEVDYSGCTAAAVFLSKEGAAKLATLLRRVLRPGTPVVCLVRRRAPATPPLPLHARAHAPRSLPPARARTPLVSAAAAG